MKHTKRLTIIYSRICIFFTLVFLFSYTRTELCGNDCCSGFTWNQGLTSCIPCNHGYYGQNCSFACSYPQFGKDCRQICNCSQDECNFEHGCKLLPEDCDIGYTGPYCDIPCRYPAYGYSCQKSCNCEERFCNVSSGCEVGSPTFESPSPSSTKTATITMLSSSTDCDIGFLGPQCNISCRYPSYGYLCQRSCNCEQIFCHFSNGCEAGSPTIEQLSPSQTEKSTFTMLTSTPDTLDDSQYLCQNNTRSYLLITGKKKKLLIFGITFLMSLSVLLLVAYLFITKKELRR
ncbi:cell death abnormality protein 1-like [Saccostrea echinata]|uniref:cell death abnormality protein 1-like n=1 Tax=Saccostrea echinata TaxID=191078 RepID=UPI002A804FDC|nr:cell death abnormality protein 1-like [Saccostrea echinata]